MVNTRPARKRRPHQDPTRLQQQRRVQRKNHYLLCQSLLSSLYCCFSCIYFSQPVLFFSILTFLNGLLSQDYLYNTLEEKILYKWSRNTAIMMLLFYVMSSYQFCYVNNHCVPPITTSLPFNWKFCKALKELKQNHQCTIQHNPQSSLMLNDDFI